MEADYLQLYAEESKQLLWSKTGMDMTRNAAVFIVFVMIIVAFGVQGPTAHGTTFFGSLVVFALALFEARLFRSQAASAYRVQVLERNFIPSVFDKQSASESNWEQQLASSYDHPLRPSFADAIAYRIAKNYFLIFLALDTSWLAKVYLYPQPAGSFREYISRLDLGILTGWAAVAFVIVFWVVFVIAVIRVRSQKKQKGYLHEQ